MKNIITPIYQFVSDAIQSEFRSAFPRNADNIMRQVTLRTRDVHDRAKLAMGFMVIHIEETDFAASNLVFLDPSFILKLSDRGPS